MVETEENEQTLWAVLASKEMTTQEAGWTEVCGRHGGNGTGYTVILGLWGILLM